MPATVAECLTLDAFQRLAEQSADADEVRRWAAHLAGCPSCAKATRTFKAEPSVLAAVESALGPREPLLVALRAQLGVPSPAQSIHVSGSEQFISLDRVMPHTPEPMRKLPLLSQPNDPPPGMAPPQSPDEMGRLVTYRVLKLLGAGAVGVVYLAEDTALRRMVALKLMRPEDAGNEIARLRFLREGRSAALLDHENVVSVYQVGEEGGVPFLAMQLLHGETLEARLDRERVLPVLEVLRIAKEIAAGLAAAHDRGLVHRDIKPANIWLESARGRVKLLDFGLARAASEDHSLTRTGTVVGTPAFMSPEQARGGPVDLRTDMYSLGCVIYQLCSGVPPLSAQDTMTMLLALATEQPRPLQSLAPNTPPPLVGLVNRLLAKQPEGRPPSCHDVMTTLETIETLMPRFMPGTVTADWSSVERVERPTVSLLGKSLIWGSVFVGVIGLAIVATNPAILKTLKEAGSRPASTNR